MADERRLAAIVFTDIVGYTTLMSEDERKALEILRRQREIFDPIIEQHREEWLKEMGDGTLSCFGSSLDAVRCAVEIQNNLSN